MEYIKSFYCVLQVDAYIHIHIYIIYIYSFTFGLPFIMITLEAGAFWGSWTSLCERFVVPSSSSSSSRPSLSFFLSSNCLVFILPEYVFFSWTDRLRSLWYSYTQGPNYSIYYFSPNSQGLYKWKTDGVKAFKLLWS